MNTDPSFTDDSSLEPSPAATAPLELEIVPVGGPDDPDPREAQAAAVVNRHVLWSLGAGLIPVPLADIAAVTAIQMDALQQLAKVYEVDFSADQGKRFVASLTGSAIARTGASLVKAIPGVGTVLGGVSMSALSGASTYAVCQVAIRHFRTGGTIFDLPMARARDLYQEALTKGRDFVKSFQSSEASKAAQEASTSIENLAALKTQGVLTDEEYEAKKSLVLAKLSAAVDPPAPPVI
jgi:uncharacterized protein (DUF697 family)